MQDISYLSLCAFNEPNVFSLFNSNLRLCASSSMVGLNRNEFNEIFLREFLIKANVYKRLAECIRNACRNCDTFTFYFDDVWINFVFGFLCYKLPHSFPY